MGTHKRFGSDDEQVPVVQQKSSGIPPVKQISKPQPRHLRKGRQQKSLRGQIRSIERLIKNRGSKLAPSALNAKKKQLAELVRLRDEHDRRENERKVANEYRMLKFFEKRKLQRVLDKIEQHGDKKEDADRKRQILRDLRYINEYPKDKKYVALFPTGGHTDRSRAKVEAIRAEIEGREAGEATGDATETAGLIAHLDEEDTLRQGGQPMAQNQDDFFLEEE